jgi:Protein of unknown function (DUF2911)
MFNYFPVKPLNFAAKQLYMKKKMIAFALLLAGAVISVNAQPIKTPAPSSTQMIKQDFGVSNIELSYSRPGVKGRTIFGDVVPFGKVWRTGANQATTISFGDTVMIDGVKIAPGKYGFVAIPEATEWTLIITKQLDVTSPAAYKQENDIVRVKSRVFPLPMLVETFTMQFGNVASSSCELQIMWEKAYLSVPITTITDQRVMADINNVMTKDNKPYFNAATYYFDNGKDLKQALAWAEKAVEQNPKAFWIIHLLAKIQAKMGDKANAVINANKSIALAKEAKNDDYVKLNEKLIAGLK